MKKEHARLLFTAILVILVSMTLSCVPSTYPNRPGDPGYYYRETNVPHVAGRSLEDARQRIFRHDLRVGNMRYLETRNRGLDGKVESQFPRPGARVRVGSNVDLTVYRYESGGYSPGYTPGPGYSPGYSPGKPGWDDDRPVESKVRVPKVKRLPLERAEIVIRDHGLRTGGLTYKNTRNRDLNMVVSSQRPRAGKLAERGQEVHLVVYRFTGPEPEAFEGRFVVVPNLIGKNMEIAERFIINSGLSMGSIKKERTRYEARETRVVNQKPAPGVKVRPGTPVDLWVDFHR